MRATRNMGNNRCWFRAYIGRREAFRQKTIQIEMSDFYGCLKDSVTKPLALSLAFSDQACNNDNVEIISEQEANRAMHQLRAVVMKQAEMFFEEFYHYNFEDMKRAIKECI